MTTTQPAAPFTVTAAVMRSLTEELWTRLTTNPRRAECLPQWLARIQERLLSVAEDRTYQGMGALVICAVDILKDEAPVVPSRAAQLRMRERDLQAVIETIERLSAGFKMRLTRYHAITCACMDPRCADYAIVFSW